MPEESRKRTETQRFGSKGRRSHDSRRFYASRMYADREPALDPGVYLENAVPEEALDRVLLASSESMHHLPDSSVHLMVTSPPYNVGKEYDEDLSLEEYLQFLSTVFGETFRVLVPGGRACVNIANLGRRPYIPLSAYVSQTMTELGFLMRGEIIWDKGASAGSSTAWGSWKSPTNPTLRDVHEYILVFSKGQFRREPRDRRATIGREEFLEFTKSIWSFPTESATRIGHPAPFPEELPYRLIQLYTFEDEVVLDPFMGSGTTAIAALRAGRHFVGYEIDETYVRIAKKRIQELRSQTPSLL